MSNPPSAARKGWRGDWSKTKLCLAKTRRGTRCQLPAEVNPLTGRSRCRLHGGLAGPRTAEGRARIATAKIRHGRNTKAFLTARRSLRRQLRELHEKVAELQRDGNAMLRLQARSRTPENDQ